MAQISTIEINTQPAQQSINSLEKALQETNEQLKQLDVNSKAFKDAQQKAAALKGQLDQVTKSTDALSKGFQGFGENLSKVGAGITGGITAATAAMQLMGVESEEVTKGIAKLQQLMALTQGISALKDLGEGFRNLKTVLGTSTKAAKLFNLALTPKWLLLIVAAVTALVAVWKRFGDQIKNAIPLVGKVSELFQKLKGDADDLTKATENYNKNLQKTEEDLANYEKKQKVSKLNAEAKKSYDELTNSLEHYQKQLDVVVAKQQKPNISKSEFQKLKEEGEALTKVIKETKDAQDRLLNDPKSFQVAKTAYKELKRYVGDAYSDILEASENQRKVLQKGYSESEEAALANIKILETRIEEYRKAYSGLHKDEQGFTEDAYKSTAEYINLQTELLKAQQEYIETFDIVNKTYGSFDVNVLERLERALQGGELLEGNIRPLQEFLNVLFKDSSVLINKLKKQREQLVAEGLSETEIQNRLFEVYHNSEFFEKFGANGSVQLENIIENLNKRFEEGLLSKETFNSLVANIYASFTELTKVIDTIFPDAVKDLESGLVIAPSAADLLETQYLQEIKGDLDAYYQFLVEYYKRRQEIDGQNYAYEIELYTTKLNQIRQQQQAVDSLTANLEQNSIAQYRFQEEQFNAEQALLDDSLRKKLISQEEYTKASNNLAKERSQFEINASLQAASGISSILSNIADSMDENNEKQFKASKSLKIASATIDMLAGITAAVSGLFTTKTGPWDIALAAIQATAIATAGAANIAKIAKTKYSSTGSVSSNVSAATITPPTQFTQAVESAKLQQQLGDNRVYVLESDITNAQKRVKVQVSENQY